MQLNALKTVVVTYMSMIMDTINTIINDHPYNQQYRILIVLMVLLLLNLIRTRKLQKQLNDIDKRNTISLLTIQHYCTSINRAVNEVFESNKTIAAENAAKNHEVLKYIRLAHLRVKDVYTGIFKHFDIKRIRRAPKPKTSEQHEKYQKEKEEHEALIRETIDEMLKTDFDR